MPSSIQPPQPAAALPRRARHDASPQADGLQRACPDCVRGISGPGHGRIGPIMANRFEAPLAAWYAANSRDLPWRRPGVGAWPILVSEFMLQQTQVARVLPAYEAWLARWPTARDLAASTPADAVRQWGRLGYPGRALRLHASSQAIASRHGGEVPTSLAELRALPGVGAYTAAAVATFAYGQRHAVLDTNVRRVLSRLVGGHDFTARS